MPGNKISWSVSFPYGNEKELKASVLKELETGDFAGVIFASNITREVERPALPEHLPAVLLNCFCMDKVPWPAIIPADLVGGHLATQHLIQQGYKRIAHITGEIWMDASRLRLEGCRRALVSNDFPVDEELICLGDWHIPDIPEETKEKVRSVIKEYRYTPNAFAQVLKGKAQSVVALYVYASEVDTWKDELCSIGSPYVMGVILNFIMKAKQQPNKNTTIATRTQCRYPRRSEVCWDRPRSTNFCYLFQR